MGNAISHQTIICATSGEPVELLKETIGHLGKLIYFYLSNCTVIKFPRNYFQDLVKLQQVVLGETLFVYTFILNTIFRQTASQNFGGRAIPEFIKSHRTIPITFGTFAIYSPQIYRSSKQVGNPLSRSIENRSRPTQADIDHRIQHH